jgi:hypothetical protein
VWLVDKMIDTGEILPFAKKHLINRDSIAIKKTVNDEPKKAEINLKTLWKEPDWEEMYESGYPKDLLAAVYTYYHSLRSKPRDDDRVVFKKVKVTIAMWEAAYIESVLFIKKWCESAISLKGLSNIKSEFNAHFTSEAAGNGDYRLYSAGRGWFHPLGCGGKYYQYQKLLPYLDWPSSVDAKKIKLFPIELIQKTEPKSFYHLCTVNMKSVTWNPEESPYPTYEDAVNALIRDHGESFASKSKNDNNELYIPRKKINNLINAPAQFDNISAKSLMDDFGFRGIQFGNALSNTERQLFVSNAYHSFLVLASILNIENRWIGAGNLGLAFGARGSGSAVAHFEPSLNIINITRHFGAGSCAHEIFHSIDNRLAKKCGCPDGLYSELLNKPLEISNQKRFRAFDKLVQACTYKGSNYYKSSKALSDQKGSRKYWIQNCELLARAFEAYIQDTVDELNLNCEWLAVGTREVDYKVDMHPYPIGKERELLNAFFRRQLKIIFGRD